MKSEIYLIFEIHHAVRDEFEKEYFPSGNTIEIFQSLTGKSPITENRLRDHSGHVVCFFYYVPKAHHLFSVRNW